MPINILMPALSPTMEKGNVAKWLKKEGDQVKAGDILAEIETDKATMEYEAIDEGVLAKILVPEGTADVAVNQPIAVLAAEGEDVKTAAAGIPAAKPSAPSPAEPAAVPQPAPPPPHPSRQAGEGRVGAMPASGVAPAPAANGRGRIFASPLARRLAKLAGLDIARITGTGPHGRIIAHDVDTAKLGGAALRAPAPSPAAPGIAPVQAPSDDKIRALFEPGSYEVVPHDNM